MQNSVKGFFEINENMIEILLIWEVLFTHYICSVVHLPSEPSLFFSKYLFGLGFKLVEDDFQHNFAQMNDKAVISIILGDQNDCVGP